MINPVLILLWGIVGWCGTPFPIRFPIPPPPPDPGPPRFVSKLIGVVAGILGGWGYTQVFLKPEDMSWNSAIPAAATAVGAFALARFVTEIYGLVSAGNRTSG